MIASVVFSRMAGAFWFEFPSTFFWLLIMAIACPPYFGVSFGIKSALGLLSYPVTILKFLLVLWAAVSSCVFEILMSYSFYDRGYLFYMIMGFFRNPHCFFSH